MDPSPPSLPLLFIYTHKLLFAYTLWLLLLHPRQLISSSPKNISQAFNLLYF